MENRTTIQLADVTRKKLRILASKRDCSYQELLEDMISVFAEIDHTKSIISIPSRITQRLHEHVKHTDFSSVSDYVTFVLRQLVADAEKECITKEEEARIKEKLVKLGYLKGEKE